MRDYLFRLAINEGYVGTPDDYDLATQQPFYCLIVKPGIEHLLAPSLARDVNTGAYHYPFLQQYWDGGTWNGQVCWVKGASTSSGTVQRLLHEMAEAYAPSEISDQCQGQGTVVVDGITVPQYWSVADKHCCPPPDPPPPPRNVLPQTAVATVVQIVFGFIGDGGGLGRIGRVPVPVDPWGWLSKSELDVAFVRAKAAVELQFREDHKAQSKAVAFLRTFRSLLELGNPER